MSGSSGSQQEAAPWHWPMPVMQVIRSSGADLSLMLHLMNQYRHLLLKLIEWSFVYLLCYLGFGYGWVVSLALIYHHHHQSSHQGILDSLIQSQSEKDALSKHLTSFPSWVTFPDYDRAQCINDLIRKLWRQIDGCATSFVQTFICPEISNILDHMDLKQLSQFQVQSVQLGTVPARVGGVKVYDSTGSRDEILLDCDLMYSGDAVVNFTLQGICAQIKGIQFRGMARLTLKPLLNFFPFVGGFEACFLNQPNLEFSLGGVACGGDLPGVKQILKSIVKENIRSRFVWPNRFQLFLPLDQNQPGPGKKEHLLRQPSGYFILRIVNGRNLIAKDRFVGGFGGSSDPYVVVRIGDRKFSYKEQYVRKTLDPDWNYQVGPVVMENWSGQAVDLEVYDFDKTNRDDFMGRVSIPMSSIVTPQPRISVRQCLDLEDVKCGKILVSHTWYPVCNPAGSLPATQEELDASTFIISVLVHSCSGLGSPEAAKGVPYPACKLWIRHDQLICSSPRVKTAEPIFEEAFLLLSSKPLKDKVIIEIIDTKSASESLGRATLPITYLLESPRLESFDMDLKLEPYAHSSIRLSAKLFYVENGPSE